MLDAVLVELSGSNGGKQKYTLIEWVKLGKQRKFVTHRYMYMYLSYGHMHRSH